MVGYAESEGIRSRLKGGCRLKACPTLSFNRTRLLRKTLAGVGRGGAFTFYWLGGVEAGGLLAAAASDGFQPVIIPVMASYGYV
jgi:hypothetical protein